MIELLIAAAGFSLMAALAGKTGLEIYRTICNVHSAFRSHATNENLTEDVAILDRVYALTDLMILAIVADGEIYESELEKMEQALRGHESELNHKEALARIRRKADEWNDPKRYRLALDGMKSRLDEDDREIGFQLVVELYRGGARLTRRAAYRDRRNNAHDFLSVFAKALLLPPERVDQLIDRALDEESPMGGDTLAD